MSYFKECSKAYTVLPLCIAITTSLVACNNTKPVNQGANSTSVPGATQSSYPNQSSIHSSSQVPYSQSQPNGITASTYSEGALLDAEDLDELEDLLQATDMTMVEDNQLAIEQFGNLWNRLRAGYGMDQNQNIYNSRIDAQKNWFVSRQDYLNRLSARASRYLYYTVQEAERRNIPTELALLPVIESSYDPSATSNASAAGLWQFIPSTGRIYGLNQSSTYDGRRDVIESTRAAYDFLTTLNNQFGSWELALAAYNAGPGRIQRAIDANLARGLPTDFWSLSLPKETMSYVPRFLAVAQIVNNPSQYGVYFPAIANRQHFRSVPVSYGITLNEVAQVTGIGYEELRALNPGLIADVVDPAGPSRVVIPNELSVNVDSQLTALASNRGASIGKTGLEYNNDPYNNTTLARSSDELAEFASHAKVPQQTTTFIEPIQANSATKNLNQTQRINTEFLQSNTLPTTSAQLTSNDTIIQEPPLSQEERDFIAYQIRKQAPDGTEVVSPVDGNIKLDAVQTQQSILESRGQEKQLSYDNSSAINLKPEGTRSVYVVQRGDTLLKIANKMGLNWRDIASWNQMEPNANLMAGSTLYLYNAKPTTAANTANSASTANNTNTPTKIPTSYIVKPGDTLIGTANRYGLTVSQLANYNGLTTTSQLRAGQKLWLVAQKGESVTNNENARSSTSTNNVDETTLYHVKSGDTLIGLAARYHVPTATLADLNGISTSDQLIIGQRLKVPAATQDPASITNSTATYNGEITNYTVQSGDNLYQLAAALEVSREDIASLNAFNANAQLMRGQVIKLPASAQKVSIAILKEPVSYKVQSGDTLIGLANRFDLSVSSLAAANDLSTNAHLIKGHTLTIPISGLPSSQNNTNSHSQNNSAHQIAQTSSYKVQSGDSLIALSRRYNVSVDELAKANNLSSNAQLKIGQTLDVPNNESLGNGDSSSTALTSTNTDSQSSSTAFDLTDTYTVQAGDTLIGLARSYGVSTQLFANENNLATNARLQRGQKLVVPKLTISYQVKSGDSLIGLARRYGITTQQLAALNNIAPNSQLQIGQTLTIPRQ